MQQLVDSKKVRLKSVLKRVLGQVPAKSVGLRRILKSRSSTSSDFAELAAETLIDDGAHALLDLLAESEKQNKTELDLGNKKIGDIQVRILTEYLKRNMTFTKLNLQDNRIGNEGARDLSASLKQNKMLTTVNFDANRIGDEGVSALVESLKQNGTLVELNLGHNRISIEGVRALAESLKYMTLTELNLEYNKIGDEGTCILAESLKQNTTLTSLDFGYNRISNKGVCALAEALKQNMTLNKLNLKLNNINNEGAHALAESLKHNTTLTELDLHSNRIGDEGVRALAASLIMNITLTGLNLGCNTIGNEGARALAEPLKQNKTLIELNLEDNRIGDEGACALADSLKQNTNLTQLNLRVNCIGNEGAQALATHLKQNTTLTELDLKGNRISDEGAFVLVRSLETLKLRVNSIGNEVVDLWKPRIGIAQLSSFEYYPSEADKRVMAEQKASLPNDEDELHNFLVALDIVKFADYLVWIPYHEFTILEKLGQGGFGTVHKATLNCNQNYKKVVALKTVKDGGLSKDQLRNELLVNIYLRFHGGGRRLAAPRLLGLSMEREKRYILVMEYAAGGNLENFLVNSPPDSWLRVWQIATGLTRRLQVIHQLNLIHNDLHPGNIVFNGDNASANPMIIDVGISNTVEYFRSLNHSRGVYGRIEYLPPEAFKTTYTLFTQKSDIYCLGTLLWQLTARFSPRGTANFSPTSASSAGLRENPIPGTPKAYEDIYKKCWNLDPDKRPTVDEVLEDLEGIEMELAHLKWLSEIPEATSYLEEIDAERRREFSDTQSSASTFASSRWTSDSRYHNQEELRNPSIF